MPRPLRPPTAPEREVFGGIRELSDQIEKHQRQVRLAATQRRRLIQGLMDDGWSMYGIAHTLGISPNRINRIMKQKEDDNA